MSTAGVVGLVVVEPEPLDDELVAEPPDVVELLTGGSSPPPVHPAKPSSAARPHAAYP